MGVSVSNVMQIAVDHRARLEAEVAKIEKFLNFADMLTQHVEKPIADLPLEECESVVQEDDRVEMFNSAPVAPEAETEELTLSEPSPAPSPAEAPAAAQAAPEAMPEAAPEPKPEMREEAPQAPAAEAASKESDASSLQDSLDALKRALKQ